jgi:hypothetical protein
MLLVTAIERRWVRSVPGVGAGRRDAAAAVVLGAVEVAVGVRQQGRQLLDAAAVDADAVAPPVRLTAGVCPGLGRFIPPGPLTDTLGILRKPAP